MNTTNNHITMQSAPAEVTSYYERLAALSEDYANQRSILPLVFRKFNDDDIIRIQNKIGVNPIDLKSLLLGSCRANKAFADLMDSSPVDEAPSTIVRSCSKLSTLNTSEGEALSWLLRFLVASNCSDLQRIRNESFLDGYLAYFQSQVEAPERLGRLAAMFTGCVPSLEILIKDLNVATLADILWCLGHSVEELWARSSGSAGQDLSDVIEFRFAADPEEFRRDRIVDGATAIDSARKDEICTKLRSFSAQEGEALCWLLDFLISGGFANVAVSELQWRNLHFAEGFVVGAQHACANAPELTAAIC